MFVGTKFGLFMPGLRPITGKEAKPIDDPRDLQVRSRRAIDLDRLREMYLPELGPTLKLPGHDYQFRAYCTKQQWGFALLGIAQDIDYTKFKDSPKQFKDYSLISAYMKIWNAALTAFPQGSIYGRSWAMSHTPVRKVTTVTTEEIGEQIPWSQLTDTQRVALGLGSSSDRLWNEREPDVWELEQIEDEHKYALWNMSETQRRQRKAGLGHSDCDHEDTRSARKRCNRKRAGK